MSMVEKETKVVNENKMTVNMTKEALYDFLNCPLCQGHFELV